MVTDHVLILRAILIGILITLVTILVLGCATPTVAKPVVALPERPELPTVTEAEVSCLSQDTYRRVILRQVLLREYAEKLESALDVLTD